MNLVKELKKKMTKWRISRELGVSWQAVHAWERGFSKPTPAHQEKLEALLNEGVLHDHQD